MEETRQYPAVMNKWANPGCSGSRTVAAIHNQPEAAGCIGFSYAFAKACDSVRPDAVYGVSYSDEGWSRCGNGPDAFQNLRSPRCRRASKHSSQSACSRLLLLVVSKKKLSWSSPSRSWKSPQWARCKTVDLRARPARRVTVDYFIGAAVTKVAAALSFLDSRTALSGKAVRC